MGFQVSAACMSFGRLSDIEIHGAFNWVGVLLVRQRSFLKKGRLATPDGVWDYKEMIRVLIQGYVGVISRSSHICTGFRGFGFARVEAYKFCSLRFWQVAIQGIFLHFVREFV